jgi:hypothetical protein
MRAPVTQGVSGLYEYTLMPTRINRRFTPSEFQGMTLHPPFGFTKGCQVLKIPAESVMTRGQIDLVIVCTTCTTIRCSKRKAVILPQQNVSAAA